MAEENTINEPKKGKKNKSGSRVINLILIIALLVAGGLFARSEMQRRAIEKNLQTTTQELQKAKESTQNNGQAEADATLARVRKLIDVPADPAPTVATITDVDSLKKTNDFYKNAVNGNNLIVTQTRAILYDPVKNIIVDVVPVTITSPSPSVAPENSPTATKKATK